jgi:peptide/nickel transport system substrate-binding protein
MLRNRLLTVLGLVLVASMILSACGAPTAAPTQAPAATAVPAVAQPEAPAAEPTAVPVTRKGGWLDEIVFSVVASESAVTQLKAGAIDLYAGGLASADLPSIKDAGLDYGSSNGLYYNILYNPAVFTNETSLNPFSNRKIREATNWLYDRNYINQEVYAGGGLQKFFAIQTNGPDYADLADVARRLESKYAYDLEKAKEVIKTEMEGMGATLGADGKWIYKDKPVTLIFLIRPDSDGTRKPIGDYVATQLEAVGFTVDRQYKKSSEAGPIWLGSDPVGGQWHLYTAAWSSTQISRDDGGLFQQMYLPTSIQGDMVFQANAADPEFQKVGDDLFSSTYTNLDQRREMMVKAMELSLQDSLQVWLIDGKNYAPHSTNVQATSDLAAGFEGAQIWPYTVRFADKEGGQFKWAEPDLFAQAWNPVAGSNWAFDNAAIRATRSGGIMLDPFTGLAWPLRLEKAEVVAQEGLPIGKTLDWADLKFEKEIKVPADALVDWDAKAQKFITAGEKFPEGTTAKTKSVVIYPANLSEIVKWHDGSPLTAGDFMFYAIMLFDQAKPESAIYDEAAVPTFESFISSFKGFRITSTSPLTVEYYSDLYALDAELNVTTFWPTTSTGEISWHSHAIANLAEAAGELAYSADKAEAAEIEETSFIGGPSLEILKKYLDQAAGEAYIPYAPTLSQYITADEAKARYANLDKFYADHSHFWIGTGPYFLDKVFLTEKSLTLKNNPDFPDLADRWSQFGEPMLAEVEIDGAGQVKIGGEATFDVAVTFNGDPYPQAEIKQVKYLLYNAKGEVVSVGQATAVADGQYQVTLPADVTSKLEAGANKIEVAVVPLPVSVPTFVSFEFVTAP